jgi:K(+)-stimulated pyrophosphate-energized sodium pump
MRIATKANVRTTQAARTSLAKALKVSFNGGSVMGLGVAGLAVLGLSALFALFYNFFMGGAIWRRRAPRHVARAGSAGGFLARR